MDPKTLQRAMPGLSESLAHEYAPHLSAAMVEGGITTQKRAAAFLAQVAHESVSLRYMEEIASGAAYEGRRDLGNTHPGDGKRYKGRGAIMLTGRGNFRSYGKLLGLPLEANPAMASRPSVGFRIAVAFWSRAGLNALADKGDFRQITRRINGGFNGWDDRVARWNTIRRLGDLILPKVETQEDRWRGSLERRRDALRRVLARRKELRKEGHDKGPEYEKTTAQMGGLQKSIKTLKDLIKRKEK